MKYCLLSFLLMIGSAMGQTKLWVPPTTNDLLLDNKSFCQKTIYFEHAAKPIKDIFPEECGGLKDKPYIEMGSGITVKRGDVPAETPDVLAVKTKYIEHRKGDSCGALTDCHFTEDEWGEKPGCADLTRILLHDEQTPPKFWCHKPVTK